MEEKTADNITINDIKVYAKNLKSFYLTLLLFFINSQKKYWYILLAGILIGCGIGYNKFKNTRSYFEGKASYTFSTFNKKMFGEMIDKLRALSASGSYKTLSEKLNISEADTRKIIDIEAVNIAGSPLSEDITESKQPFYIRIKLSDRQIADTLVSCVENYLNNNPQVKSQMANNLIKMKERLLFINTQIQKLDSLKSTYQFYLAHQNVNSGSIINTFNPVDLFTQSEKLATTKTDLEWGVINYKVIKILDPFVISDNPVSPSLKGFLIKYTLMGLLISIVLSLLLYSFKKI